ncbi:hypothetical protein Salat_2094200, partial [Sesamum alatum]
MNTQIAHRFRALWGHRRTEVAPNSFDADTSTALLAEIPQLDHLNIPLNPTKYLRLWRSQMMVEVLNQPRALVAPKSVNEKHKHRSKRSSKLSKRSKPRSEHMIAKEGMARAEEEENTKLLKELVG